MITGQVHICWWFTVWRGKLGILWWVW